MIPALALRLSLATLATLAATPAADLPRGAPVEKVECRGVPGKSYALYLPSAYSPERKWPILYLLDPRARGMVPMPLVTAAAERFGWIVASSNDSQGDGSLDLMRVPLLAMLADTHARFAVDDARVYLGGFSAGARSAAFFGQVLKTPPAGVFGCGAGFLDDHPPTKETRFAWVGLVGDEDFNYVEMKRLAPQLEKLGVSHRLVLFQGPHSWPPREAFEEGIAWMEALAKARAKTPDPALLAEVASLARRAEEEKLPLEALERWEAIAKDLAPLGDVSEAQARAKALRAALAKELREDAKRDERDGRILGRLEGTLMADINQDPPAPAAKILADLGVADLKARAAGSDHADAAAAKRILNALRARLGSYLPRDLEEKGDTRRAALARAVAAEIRK